MRRRDRFAGYAWFAGWADEPSRGVAEVPPHVASGDDALLETLAHTYGMSIELEAREGEWGVRLFPVPLRGPDCLPLLALSYIGLSLGNISARAVYDLRRLCEGKDLPRYAGREVRRCVPS